MDKRILVLFMLVVFPVCCAHAGSYKFEDIVSYVKDDSDCLAECQSVVTSMCSIASRTDRSYSISGDLSDIYPEAAASTRYVQLGDGSSGVALPAPLVYSIAPRLHVVINYYSTDVRAPSCFYLLIDMGR